MNFQSILPDKSINLFVKNIWVFEKKENTQTSIPFFADGYPGLMFQESNLTLSVLPHNKKMPTLFLYGQTITPITLEINSPYQIIIFQFYPFVLRAFWDITPESINDNCYFLDNSSNQSHHKLVENLINAKSIEERIHLISNLLIDYFEKKKVNLDLSIRNAIVKIITEKGQIQINSIAQSESLNIRTFERRFLKETGLSAKQFSKIIQFQSSLQQLTAKDYKKLTDIVYENGFSDQSHFIRVFKAFTGKTPKKFG
ncbi:MULTISPECIES: AraC family transcriptional regulator [unclassified Empedobacter]|jgi:AraC-like DNA-binding protein|uniref:helix-turn-helix domain-containing protein n=1 Tax=unclassified Empedobacter TaxID=2643773 RepID=UPI0025C18C5A|nr:MULTISPECIES: helix-turn-helix domain-containing protein [unclassified Empedobacter]